MSKTILKVLVILIILAVAFVYVNNQFLSWG